MGNPQHNIAMSIASPYRPIHPSPLSQSMGASDLEKEISARRHSNHPTFQQILKEVTHDSHSKNAVLGFHEYNEMAKSVRLATLATNPTDQSNSLLKAGTIFSSDDIIYSTLLDGPYRQARSKSKPVTPTQPNNLGKPMASSDQGRRLTGNGHRVHPQPNGERDLALLHEKARNRDYYNNYHLHQSHHSTHSKQSQRQHPLGRPMSSSEKTHSCMEGIPMHKTRSRPSSPRPEINQKTPSTSSRSDPARRIRSRPTSPQGERRKEPHSRPFSSQGVRSPTPHSRSHGVYDHRVRSRPSSPQEDIRHRFRPGSPNQRDSLKTSSRNHKSSNHGVDNREHSRKNDSQRNGSHRLSKSESLTIDEGQTNGEKKAQVAPILLNEGKSNTDWEFLENIAGRLSYNHLTKEARLVYFEDGKPPKRKLLPKRNLIPPSQLIMDRSTVSTPKPPKRTISDPILAERPPLPPKSPARRFSARRATSTSPPESSDDLFSSPFWKESEEIESPVVNVDISKDIMVLFSKAGATKIASLGKPEGDSPPVSPLSLSVEEDINEKAWGLASNPEHGSLRRRPSSAFEKKIKCVAPYAISQPEAVSIIRPQNWLSMLRPSGENGGMYIAGDPKCAILCGNLYKLGGNRQWQKRQFRADGFTLVCLSKEPIRAHAGSLNLERPNYFEEDWRSYCHPTCPPTPRLTHPLVATASRTSPHRLEYHQAPKWVIPIGEIVEVSLLTRKGLRVTDSFVIHTRGRNYIIKATNQHELASWIYMLQRMIVTYQDCRTLVPGFTKETLPRSTSVGELHSNSGLGLGLKPLSGHKPAHRTRPASQDQTYSSPRNERTDSTQRLQQQTRRAPSIFQALKCGKVNHLSDLQLQKEIAQDWAGGLASLSYCRRSPK